MTTSTANVNTVSPRVSGRLPSVPEPPEHDYKIQIDPVERPSTAGEPGGNGNGAVAPQRIKIELTLSRPEDKSFCKELVASLERLVAADQKEASTTLRYHDVVLDRVKRTVSRGERAIWLTQKEYELCVYFLQRPERVLTRENILERVWGLNHNMEYSNVVEVYVSRLRKKIDAGFDKQLIHTAIGFGYILSADGPPSA